MKEINLDFMQAVANIRSTLAHSQSHHGISENGCLSNAVANIDEAIKVMAEDLKEVVECVSKEVRAKEASE